MTINTIRHQFNESIYTFDGFDILKDVKTLMKEVTEETESNNPEIARISNICSQWIISSIFKNYESTSQYTDMKSDLKKLLVHHGYCDAFHFTTNEDYPLNDHIEGIIITDEYRDYYLIYRIIDYGYQSDISIIKLNCDDQTLFSLLSSMYITIGDDTYDNAYDGYHYLKYDQTKGDYDYDTELDPDDISDLINTYITNHPNYGINVYSDDYQLVIN